MNAQQQIKLVILTLILSVSFSTTVFTQIKTDKQTIDQTISAMTVELQHKILLTDEQASKVTEILKIYFSKVSADATEKLELRNKTNSDVLSILDKKQKAKFDILKNDWWKSK
jgi:hypothetical protein